MITNKNVGIYFHNNSNLLVIIYETTIIVYDYVQGTINERVHCEDNIASFYFYNGSVFCGCKNSVITRTKLKSFPNDSITGIVKADEFQRNHLLTKFGTAVSKKGAWCQEDILKRQALEI